MVALSKPAQSENPAEYSDTKIVRNIIDDNKTNLTFFLFQLISLNLR